MFATIEERYGRLDMCINNAGLAHAASVTEGETELWRDMFEVKRDPSAWSTRTGEFSNYLSIFFHCSYI